LEKELELKKMTLIPAGSFEMGDHLDRMANSQLVHTVELDAFYMDIHEVTVGKFKQFVEDSGYAYNKNLWNEAAKYSPTDEHPMVYVNSNDATAYAQWAGKWLPTETEWEYAARGGLISKRYPWGNERTRKGRTLAPQGGGPLTPVFCGAVLGAAAVQSTCVWLSVSTTTALRILGTTATVFVVAF